MFTRLRLGVDVAAVRIRIELGSPFERVAGAEVLFKILETASGGTDVSLYQYHASTLRLG